MNDPQFESERWFCCWIDEGDSYDMGQEVGLCTIHKPYSIRNIRSPIPLHRKRFTKRNKLSEILI